VTRGDIVSSPWCCRRFREKEASMLAEGEEMRPWRRVDLNFCKEVGQNRSQNKVKYMLGIVTGKNFTKH
jgi:hypothetical protein